MKRILLYIFLICSSAAFGQISSYSIQIGTGLPAIGTVSTSDKISFLPSTGFSSYTTPITTEESYKAKPGINLSGVLNYKLSEKYFLTTGISFNYLRYDRVIKIKDLAPEFSSDIITFPRSGSGYGIIYGQWNPEGGTTLTPPSQDSPLIIYSPNKAVTTLYLQVPVLAGTSFYNKRLVIRTGAAFSYLLNASVYKQKMFLATGSGSALNIEEYKDNTTDGFSKLSVGAVLQTTYQLTKAIGIDLSAQKNFSPMHDGGKAKINLLSVGARYNFMR